MTQDEFIDKWLVGYESREQKEEFVIEMRTDLASLQSKGKTKKEVAWTDADIQEAFAYGGMKSNGQPAYNVLTWFPYFKQEKIDNAMEEYAQSHANQDEQIKRGDWVFTPDETFGSAGKKNLVFQFDERIEYSLHFGHEPRLFKIDPIVAEFINANKDGWVSVEAMSKLADEFMDKARSLMSDADKNGNANSIQSISFNKEAAGWKYACYLLRDAIGMSRTTKNEPQP